MKHLIATIAFACAATVGLAATDAELTTCAGKETDAAKLSCFQGLVPLKSPQPTVAEGATICDVQFPQKGETHKLCLRKLAENKNRKAQTTLGNGQWRIRTDKSALDDSKTIFVSTATRSALSDRFGKPQNVRLLLRCMENTTSVMLITNMFLSDNRGNGVVEMRVDKNPAQKVRMVASTSNDTLGLWSGSKSIPVIKSMFDANDLVVRFTPYGESPVVASFDIRGVEAAVTDLRATCGW